MFRKTLTSFGGVALAAAILFFAAPRAAHAITPALVQVTNTVANPAITQATDKQANQMVQLVCPIFYSVPSGNCSQIAPGGTIAYSSSQYFVITGVDVLPLNVSQTTGCSSSSGFILSVNVNGNQRFQWVITGPGSSHFAYPTGIVTLPAGESLVVTSVDLLPGSAGAGTNGIGIGNFVNGRTLAQFLVTNSLSTTLQLPNGIVYPAGESVTVTNFFNSTGPVVFALRGYLTSN